jgi:hypothetical protein
MNRKRGILACKRTQRGKGYIYFLRGEITELIKIGYTSQPINHRISCLQSGSPDILHFLGAFPGTRTTENSLHRRWSHLRQHGEWFAACEDMRRYISDKSTVKPEVR